MTDRNQAANPVGVLECTVVSGVATLVLNRPERRNALSPELIVALVNALDGLRGRDDVNVIVITGNGPAFCAGLDLSYLSTLSAEERVRYMRSAFDLFAQWQTMPQPTIAAINGVAVAGGFDLALFSDLRFCAPSACFGQPEIVIGATQFLYPLWTIIGMGRALELALTGDTISADEAYRIGLVNAVKPAEELLASTHAFARNIAGRPRDALFSTKRLGRDLVGLTPDAARARIGEALDCTLRSQAHRDALEAFLKNRKQTSG